MNGKKNVIETWIRGRKDWRRWFDMIWVVLSLVLCMGATGFQVGAVLIEWDNLI